MTFSHGKCILTSISNLSQESLTKSPHRSPEVSQESLTNRLLFNIDPNVTMRKILALLLIAIFLTLPSLIISKPVSATNAANNSLSPSATLLWNYTTSNGVWSSPTIDSGVLYVGCEDVVYTGTQVSYAGNLYALNAANGDKLWNYSIPDGGSSPAVASGVVYVGSFDGNVYAFNATNGVKLWSYPAGDMVSSSPAVADGIVYIGLSDGNLVALNGKTGEEVWKYHI